MLQLNVNLPELRDFAKALPEFKGNLFSLLRLDIKQAATEFVNDLLQCEFDLFIGREKNQRDAVEIKGRNLRNGFYQRKFSVKGLGKLIIDLLHNPIIQTRTRRKCAQKSERIQYT